MHNAKYLISALWHECEVLLMQTSSKKTLKIRIIQTEGINRENSIKWGWKEGYCYADHICIRKEKCIINKNALQHMHVYKLQKTSCDKW